MATLTKQLFEELTYSAFEERVLDVLKKHGIYNKDVSIGYNIFNEAKTFTLNEIIIIINSLEVKRFYNSGSLFGNSIDPELIDKNELITKLNCK